MGCAVLTRLARVRATVAYAVALVVVSTTLLRLGPDVKDRVVRHVSTNLHNLSHGRVETLVGSAFVTDTGPILEWLPGLICLLALGELLWRSGRMMVAFGIGHIGASLLVAAGLTAAVELGRLPGTVTRAPDVGMSYGATAVLGALTAAVPSRWRSIWIGWWLAVAVAVVAIGWDFTTAGHAMALLLGMVAATRFGRPQPWAPTLVALLGVASTFGFLILVSNGAPMAEAGAAGLVGAALGRGWAHHVARRSDQECADVTVESGRTRPG